jgi:hypothetical protein
MRGFPAAPMTELSRQEVARWEQAQVPPHPGPSPSGATYAAPYAAENPVAGRPLQPETSATSATPQDSAASRGRPDAARAPQGAGAAVDVELGTHSASNFYKGLGGNDVIEHGGVFVATYRVPKIGSVVALRVLLPGDYEFRAVGTVQWTRDPGSAEPGFGARFTQISPEGRQLVYRYTRNREPMFYDDL